VFPGRKKNCTAVSEIMFSYIDPSGFFTEEVMGK
jgi:hypothetical protein